MAVLLSPSPVLVIAMLLPSIVCVKVVDIEARVENMGEASTPFSGSAVHLRCTILDQRSTWERVWLLNNRSIAGTAGTAGGELRISPTVPEQHSGFYSCYGVRVTKLEIVHTRTSPPLEIVLNDGSVQIRLGRPTVLVDGPLDAECLVRDTPELKEVRFYKDEVLVFSRKDGRADLHVPHANLTHQGMYTCNASWLSNGKLTMAASTPGALLIVKEVLNEPRLTLEPHTTSGAICLSCVFEFNKEDPATQVHVYFYRNGRKLLGVARSEQNPDLTIRTKDGWYGCKARVPALGLVRWSPLTKYGDPTDEQLAQALAL